MRTGRYNRLTVAAFFIIGVVIGAGCFQLYLIVSQPTNPALSLDEQYQNAIEDAMTAKPSEVYSSLTAIVESNGNLTWRGETGNRTVLVATFTKYASSYPVSESVNTTWGETWVTVVPEIQTFFQTHADSASNLTLRVLQLLGLPPDDANTYFVEMWVHPNDLFRPTPDNEITDTTAQLSFPDSATPEYKEWFNSNIIYSYFPPLYPWTRLGYTYDWGDSNTHVGLSEFVLKPNSMASVESVTLTTEYLNVDG